MMSLWEHMYEAKREYIYIYFKACTEERFIPTIIPKSDNQVIIGARMFVRILHDMCVSRGVYILQDPVGVGTQFGWALKP